MKKFRKLLSLVLAMVMVLAMAAPTMASGEYSITINDTGEYEAYQIFTGTLNSNKTVLSNIQWGNGITDDGKTALGNAADVAKTLDKATDNSTAAQQFADTVSAYLNAENKKTGKVDGNSYKIENLDAGYYLVRGTKKGESGESGHISYTKYILELVDDVNVTPKTDVPSAAKKVEENSTSSYRDVADYNIGDDVPFKFTSKVPDMTYFSTYKMVFEDTMSAGFDAAKDIVVKIGTKTLTRDNEYTVDTVSGDSNDFKITIADLKTITDIAKGDAIEITFTAKLNDNANVGQSGNTNEMKLIYSNNPNDSTGTGTTPVDKVVVFTYELEIEKVASGSDAKKLPDAEFKLKNKAGKYAQFDVNSKVTGWVEVETNAGTVTTDASGMAKIIGLDAGEYELIETKAPDGYNIPKDPFKVVITSTTADEWNGVSTAAALTNLQVTIDDVAGTPTLTTGNVKVTIANSAGIQLPSTGGIGTTIFYAAGIILMAGAVFFVVRRKRA